MEIVALGGLLLPLLALWIVIYTAVRTALRHDRQQADREHHSVPR